MNIWVIGRNYPKKSNKMQGQFELNQAKMLAGDDWNISYLACILHPINEAFNWGSNSWIEDSVHVYTYAHFFTPHKKHLYLKKYHDRLWEQFLNRVEQKEGKPDIIHIHYPVLLMIVDIVEKYKKQGTKIIFTEHWSKVLQKKIDRAEYSELMACLKQADAFLCVGNTLKTSIIDLSHTRTKIDVVPNVFNNAFHISTKQHYGFKFVSVGRLIPLKQFDKVLEVFQKSFSSADDVFYTIIGSGSELNKLQSIINRHRLEKRVLLTGALSSEETAEIVSNSDCLVSYSLYETFCVPIIEAWACGLPVIASETSGVNPGDNPELGICVDPTDEETLAKAMIGMEKKSTHYEKKYIRTYAENNYSQEYVLKQLKTIYKNCFI